MCLVVVQPSGTVTLVFTDVEGSTVLLGDLGAEAYRKALAEHRRVVREAFAAHSGYEVDDAGDGLFYAFASASGAVSAVARAMALLAEGPVRVRVGVHTGEPVVDPPKYVGADVHKAARIMSAAHGGQVLLSAATRELVAVDLLDLGRHRLKDFDEPVSLFQLGAGRFPPLRTISNTNLPVPLSSFVGRAQEVGQVVALVRDEGARLVTLHGAGGTGKTRLAIEAAGELVSEFKAGVFWVGLASLRDPALVAEAVAQTLGANEELASHIGDQEMLLVLDNFEQVVDAAPVLSGLLQTCSNLRLLVTSRELLRVQGEVEYPVLPLAEREAVGLFCTRSRQKPDEIIRELCRRLDNLPLGIELAAARTSALSPAQILDRLSQRLDLLKGGRDAVLRQQTLRATIEWSYELLSPRERKLFRRLSVFAAGSTLAMAEEVCDADLDTLQSLVDKSLVRFSVERYWMLETVAVYAAERLELVGERERVTRRFADNVAALDTRGPGGRTFFSDIGNWRRALEWSLESDDPALGLCLCMNAGSWRPTPAEVLHWNVQVAAGTSQDPVGLGRLLTQQARAEWVAGESSKSAAAAERAVALLRGSDHLPSALNVLGLILAKTDPERARATFEQAHELAAGLGQGFVAVEALHNRGELERDQGHLAEAQMLMERALSDARQAGYVTAPMLHGLGDLALDSDSIDEARRLYAEAFWESVHMQWRMPTILAVAGLAVVFALDGRTLEAGRLWGAAQALAEGWGHRFGATASASEVRRYEARLPPPTDPIFARGVNEGRLTEPLPIVEATLRSAD